MRDIIIQGAREHDLDLDLVLPGGRWTAVVGVSGSGKTSLVFDTLVREGRRRFLQSRSARARRQLGKLGSADVERLTGLPVPLAVGAGRLTRSERSTFGTMTGLIDPLRLLFAREGSGGPHTRSTFSSNSSGACGTCAGLGQQEAIAVDRIVVHPERSIREGALGPTLPNGYTVYSQVTLEVMDRICRAHGFDVDTPWEQLEAEQQEVVLYGTRALKVPFGKHSLESRLKWEGITARPREMGYYRGLVPVMSETLKRSRNANILRYARSVPCADCGGTRLGEAGRTARIGSRTFPEVCGERIDGLLARFDPTDSPVWRAVREGFVARVDTAVALGLGHLALERPTTTLSDGELQRARLVSQLGVRLSGMLLAFDEPTLGLHPGAQAGLERALRDLQALGNTLVTVEHDPAFVSAADELVQLGPGAGSEGGRLVRQEPMSRAPLGDGRGRSRRRPGCGEVVLRGAHLHGLDTDLSLLRAGLNVVCGPSGAGKSSLVFGTLLPILEGREAACSGLEGAEGLVVRSVDARPLGRTPRSTPATYTGVFDAIRKLYARQPDARARKLTASHFSHNHKAGRCPACEGLGVERVGLHLMRDVERTCPACGGGRYADEVLAVTFGGATIADVLACPVDEALPLFEAEPRIRTMLEALSELGLGYLPLGRSTTAISRGEAQRIKLATLLGKPEKKKSIVLLDEPDRGLHPSDLERLVRGLHALVDGGHTVVAISHSPLLWGTADRLVEVVEGRASVLERVPEVPPRRASGRPPVDPPDAIVLQGVRTGTLDLDVRFPHGALSVVCGVSGSGKSTLVFDVLAAEAHRRFAESLPFEVRRHLRKVTRPQLEEASGLTPTLVLGQRVRDRYGRATVATLSGIGPDLRLLFAREGTRGGEACGLAAEAFSPLRPAGACGACGGRATVRTCTEAGLVTHPQRSILEGALSGTRPGRFFTEAGGRHLALLEAVGGARLLETPWMDLTHADRELVLHGAPEVVRVTWRFERGGRSGEHVLEEPWTGFLALVGKEAENRKNRKDADVWWAPFEEIACDECAGTGLNPRSRTVEWGGHTLPALLGLSIDDARVLIERTPTGLAPLTSRLLEGLDALADLALGHLPLDRRADDLASGELQRVRLAEVLSTGLCGLTLALDEPASGLDADAVEGLCRVLKRLVAQGNTVVAVSHREPLLRAADHLVEMGPGAGEHGGRVVAVGVTVLEGDGPTARALRRGRTTVREAPLALEVLGVRLPGGASVDLRLPERGLVALAGPSGCGKSSVLRALETRAPACFRSVVRPVLSGSETVGYALGAMKAVCKRFSVASGRPPKTYAFKSPAGRCPVCKGTGVERVALDVLADLRVPCPACGGSRYAEASRQTLVDGRDIVDTLALPLSALDLPGLDPDLVNGLRVGHLTLSRRLSTLSGGERQRLALLQALSGGRSPRLVLLDEPGRGLHPLDVQALVEVLEDRPDDLFVYATHRPELLERAHHVVRLG